MFKETIKANCNICWYFYWPCHVAKARESQKAAAGANCQVHFCQTLQRNYCKCFFQRKKRRGTKTPTFSQEGVGGAGQKKLDSFSFHLAKKNFMRTFPSALDLISFFVEGMTWRVMLDQWREVRLNPPDKSHQKGERHINAAAIFEKTNIHFLEHWNIGQARTCRAISDSFSILSPSFFHWPWR